ncbi:putative ATP-dependent RNA helicase DHX34 like protein [Argiope bruennichi]|uniref:Putative ATP-dependent RNA helicase DHX34 like protein n=1 Tax=Argiope bruennichi TaxID=94029 RepID=A0A8T0FP65_ARGBR|nr:putative ATP-dependent RNA helicase DHX34 like protein [Argiope bruennichi]
MERHKKRHHYDEKKSSKYHKITSEAHVHEDEHENIRKKQIINQDTYKGRDVYDGKEDEKSKPSFCNRVYLNKTDPDFPWTEYRSTLNKIFFYDKGKIKSGMTEISIVEEAARAYGDKSNKWIILPLHSTLSIEDQDKASSIEESLQNLKSQDSSLLPEDYVKHYLVDLEDKYLQYVQKHWTCPSCGKEMVATVLDQIRHKETCEAQNEKITDTSEELNKGPPKKPYFCPSCQEELQLTLPEILRHKRSHTSSS